MEYVLTGTKNEARAGSYYDKIAAYYDLTFKLNGYGRSLDQYFANHPLPISRGAKILDAGCGTGLTYPRTAALDPRSSEHHSSRSFSHFNRRGKKSGGRESWSNARRNVCRRKPAVASLH